MYDIIGDIHGHADELVELLETLGYREHAGCFRHPQRTAVYCGDFVDRGPQIPDVVRIVRAMVQGKAALAVMGNHEFNALAYDTEKPGCPGQFCRPHDTKNQHQHAATLQQFDRRQLQEALEWFRTLPVALDLGSLRVVHACWSPDRINHIQAAAREFGEFTGEFLSLATTAGTELFDAVECVMKGPELWLPEGITVRDKEGNVRRRIRIRWFEQPLNRSFADYALPEKKELPDSSVPHDAPAEPYAADQPPVFVGHYWLPDRVAAPLAPNVACLDYSIARNGMLCAYRFDGETTLSGDKFTTIPSRTQRNASV